MCRWSSPASLWGELFEAVQMQGIFRDSKTFADAVPLRGSDVIMRDFCIIAPLSDAELQEFVLGNFNVSRSDATQFVERESQAVHRSMREHIRELLRTLTRTSKVLAPGSSRLPYSGLYVVPGGRFEELYYWDSFFTMLGLQADGNHKTIESILDGFCYLIENYGYIPNGTRTYYLSRSQPPLFYAMCGLSRSRDSAILSRRLNAMLSEHAFWMSGADRLPKNEAAGRVVALPDGSVLNRYWDECESPRDEGFREDVLTARSSARDANEVYRDLRAAAESGWDFSSRWFSDGHTLSTVRTTAIIPVDLNSYLYGLESAICRQSAKLGMRILQDQFRRLANLRKDAINRYLWNEGTGYFVDYDWRSGQKNTALTAASLSPLFAGLATRASAAAMAAIVDSHLLAAGGVRTTLVTTGEQWDSPNGWAPLQWIAVQGLARYGYHELAEKIAQRWITTVEKEYLRSYQMLEKYDVEALCPGGGGEYPPQDGFGWTNGVTAALFDRYNSL